MRDPLHGDILYSARRAGRSLVGGVRRREFVSIECHQNASDVKLNIQLFDVKACKGVLSSVCTANTLGYPATNSVWFGHTRVDTIPGISRVHIWNTAKHTLGIFRIGGKE